MEINRKDIRDQLNRYFNENSKEKTIETMTQEINDLLGTAYSSATIRGYAKRLGFTPLTEREQKAAFIKNNLGLLTIEQLAEKLNCQVINIKSIIKKLELNNFAIKPRTSKKDKKSELREKVDQYIIENREKKTAEMLTKEINQLFGSNYSTFQIRGYAKELGCTPISEWEYRILFIKSNLEHLTIEDFAKELNCQEATIKRILKTLGLIAKQSEKPIRPTPEKTVSNKKEKSFSKAKKVLKKELNENHVPSSFEQASPDFIEYVEGLLPKNTINRPPAVYTQSGSPYGIASNLDKEDE